MYSDSEIKKRMMTEVDGIPAPLVLDYIDFGAMTSLFQRLGAATVTNDHLYINSLKFLAGKKLIATKDTTMKTACEHSVPVLDYIIAMNLIANGYYEKIEFKVEAAFKQFNFNNDKYVRAFGAFLLLVVIRNDPSPNENTSLPTILKKVFDVGSQAEYRAYLSVNDLRNIRYEFVFDMDWSLWPVILKERIRLGIAGSRLIRVFNYYTPRDDISEQHKRIYNLLKSISKKGIYLEYHPRMNARKDLNLSKNLLSLIGAIYDENTINQMVLDKRIASVPIVKEFMPTYLTWDERTFDYLKNLLDDKLKGPVVDDSEMSNK